MRFLTPFLFLFSTCIQAQTLVKGGLQGDKTLILTPKGISNENPATSKQLGFHEPGEDGKVFELAPDLPGDWTWIAATNVPLRSGKRTNVFFYNSWVGTSEKINTTGRRRDFGNEITPQVASNVYHIALHRESMVENEAFIFLVSPKKQKVVVELPASVFKTQRRLEYDMEAWEAKFVHVVVPPAEHTQVVWKPEPPTRNHWLLRDGWQFAFTKGDSIGPKTRWETVRVPHVFGYWEHFDARPYKDSLDVTEMYPRGLGWYRRTFTVPGRFRNQYVKINFLAANQRADVWLNGKYLGKHLGGYTDFHFSLDGVLKFDQPNELLVKVDNRYHFDIAPHTADYNAQGGIYREVELLAWPRLFVRDIRITTPNVTPTVAEAQVRVQFNNKSASQAVRVAVNLVNPYGEIQATQWADHQAIAGQKTDVTVRFANVKNPHLWSPETPTLYQIHVLLYDKQGKLIDQTGERFGFRFYEFDKDKGFSLNGMRVKLKGVNAHQDNYGTGWAMDSAAKRRDYILMKRMGVNFIRLSHYPHHPYELFLCDSLGIMAWAEIPVVNSVGKEAFVKNAVKQMEEMINRDKNHPSILTWGVGNEYYRDYFTKDEMEWALRCTEAVAKKAKELDPTRPTTQAQNDLADDRIMKLTDLHGRNRYFGWYTGGSAYGGFTGYDGFAKQMEIERRKYPDWKVIISEYGAEGKYGYHVPNPVRFDHSETYMLDFHKAYWEYIAKTDWIAGSTLWTMFDFVSFAKIGNVPHINQKGMMTYDRKPKSLYYYYQSQWTTEPMVYINSHTNTHRTGDLSKPQPVEIFSNCAEVELFVNGQSAGKRTKANGYVWNVAITQGFHDFKAVGTQDGETVRHTLRVHYAPGAANVAAEKGKDSD